MINSSEAPIWIVIVRNVLISAVAGTLLGCALLPLFDALLNIVQHGDYMLFDPPLLLKKTLTSPFLIFFIAPILLPLVGTACVAGVLFQISIQKHLLLWCILSPIAVWLAAIAILVWVPVNSYYEQFNWFERLLINIPDPDHFPFLIAPAFSAVIFYKLSKKV